MCTICTSATKCSNFGKQTENFFNIRRVHVMGITQANKVKNRSQTRGGLLRRNWDKSLKSFPPCYSPQQTDLTPPPPPQQKCFKTSSLRTPKILPRNLNEIVRSWIRLQQTFEQKKHKTRCRYFRQVERKERNELTYTPDIHSLAVRFLCQHLRSYIAYKSKAQECTCNIYVGV